MYTVSVYLYIQLSCKYTFYNNNLCSKPQTEKLMLCNITMSVPQFSSVAQPCPTLCDLMDCSTPGFPVHHRLLELAQTCVHRVSDVIQPSHPVIPFSSCLPLLLLPSIFPRIRVFSNESVLHIRWPKSVPSPRLTAGSICKY